VEFYCASIYPKNHNFYQGFTNPGPQSTRVTNFYTVEPNTWVLSTELASPPFWRLAFWASSYKFFFFSKICTSLILMTVHVYSSIIKPYYNTSISGRSIKGLKLMPTQYFYWLTTGFYSQHYLKVLYSSSNKWAAPTGNVWTVVLWNVNCLTLQLKNIRLAWIANGGWHKGFKRPVIYH
jgi:hypothetical protein